ncbi:MAG TPA: hypothetical protein VK952_01940 [Methylotenera sp.]|nr:hypothetical protein [Methylotenera sp.]
MNLNKHSAILNAMLKRFSLFFAYWLLLVIPLQGIAAANMSICNSLMQPNAQQVSQEPQALHDMPCHDSMDNNKQHAKKHGENNPCKTSCAVLCASLNAMTALPSTAPATTFLVTAQTVNIPQQIYVSITQPSLQRPPISFI